MNYTKKFVLPLIFFILFSSAVCFVPQITAIDIQIIKCVQNALSGVSAEIPAAAGGAVFYAMIFLPVLSGCLYFLFKKEYKNAVLFVSAPVAAYFLNGLIKAVINRPRPPLELQLEEHMTSSSYVSRHTFVTAVLWGIIIYFIWKYCGNKALKYIFTALALLWILFEGFSRIWLGVHYPTDVTGAFILSFIFIPLFIKLFKKNE